MRFPAAVESSDEPQDAASIASARRLLFDLLGRKRDRQRESRQGQTDAIGIDQTLLVELF